jgi:hypothetical protein
VPQGTARQRRLLAVIFIVIKRARFLEILSSMAEILGLLLLLRLKNFIGRKWIKFRMEI